MNNGFKYEKIKKFVIVIFNKANQFLIFVEIRNLHIQIKYT